MFETRIRYIFFLFLQIQVSILLLRPLISSLFAQHPFLYYLHSDITEKFTTKRERSSSLLTNGSVAHKLLTGLFNPQIIYMKNREMC